MSRPWLLVGGMLVGAALAVFYIVRLPQTAEPTADAVAWVNERPISRGSYEAALQAVAGDRKSALDMFNPVRAEKAEHIRETLAWLHAQYIAAMTKPRG